MNNYDYLTEHESIEDAWNEEYLEEVEAINDIFNIK